LFLSSLPHPYLAYLIYSLDGQHKEPQRQHCQPPPPPPPAPEQVLAMQAQMPQTMQQTMVNMQDAQHQVPPPPLRDRLGDFQCTKPPTLSHSI
jgi:hypothetical protein